jgi:cell cycle checkpoint control protein RAD9A
VLVHSKHGLTKTYECCTLEEPEVLCASIDKRTLHARLVLKPKELNKLLSNFHSGQVDVTFLSLPAAAQQGGVVAAPAKRLRLSSYIDPAKPEPPGARLMTRLAVDTGEEWVAGYSHRGAAPLEATVNLKDLKARVGGCACAVLR